MLKLLVAAVVFARFNLNRKHYLLLSYPFKI